MSVVYPDEYTDEDKAVYDDLMSRGRMMIGKKVKKANEFLLDLAAKMTINQMKGYKPDLSPDEILSQMAGHKEALQGLDLTTPVNMYEEGQHPLELNPIPKTEFNDKNENEYEAITNQDYTPEPANKAHVLDCNIIQ